MTPNSYLSPTQQSLELLKCKQNPIYFILKYVYIPEIGGEQKYNREMFHKKLKRVIRLILKYQKVAFMASRQHGKSTIMACLLAWALIFYPGIRAVILNMKKNAGLENLSKIKFIINNLPSWMVSKKPFKSKSDIKTYFELHNGSKCEVFYPSTIHSADTLARSLTSSILYIDEAAFIRNMADIFGSAQPILSKARTQAKKRGYPYFIAVTTTPNGSTGDGEWFFKLWDDAIDSDELFICNNNDQYVEDWNPNNLLSIEDILKKQDSNTFLKVVYHWSENPLTDENWYIEQKLEINDTRRVNQEVDLKFIGSSNCILDDELISRFKAKQPEDYLYLPHGGKLDVFDSKLNPSDYYIISADTAESITGAFCAVQIFSFKEFKQVAELQCRFGSFTVFAKNIHKIFKWVQSQVGNKIILTIENNTIGKAVIENLLENQEVYEDIDYREFLLEDVLNKTHAGQLGIKTTGDTKKLYIGCLLEYITNDPECIYSQNLLNQLSGTERTNSGGFKFASYSDLLMAAGFAAYTRHRKLSEILPILTKSPKQVQNDHYKNVKQLLNIASPTHELHKTLQKEKSIYPDELADFNFSDLTLSDSFIEMDDNKSNSFIPFFNE